MHQSPPDRPRPIVKPATEGDHTPVSLKACSVLGVGSPFARRLTLRLARRYQRQGSSCPWLMPMRNPQPLVGMHRRAVSKSQQGVGSGLRIANASSALMSCITAFMPARID